MVDCNYDEGAIRCALCFTMLLIEYNVEYSGHLFSYFRLLLSSRNDGCGSGCTTAFFFILI